MQSLMKINGTWKEGTPYLKEGGTWKEIGAVTAKANGKWADIALPEPPAVDPRIWTEADFDYDGVSTYKIKGNIRQFFIVGDKFDMDTPRDSDLYDDAGMTPTIPGVTYKFSSQGNQDRISGTIQKGAESLTNVFDVYYEGGPFGGIITYTFRTADGSYIPIKAGGPEPPKPAGKHWTEDDFVASGEGIIGYYKIVPEQPQYFTVGDSFDVASVFPSKFLKFGTEGHPEGLVIENGRIVGTITGPPKTPNAIFVSITDGKSPRNIRIQTNSGDIPTVKPAP